MSRATLLFQLTNFNAIVHVPSKCHWFDSFSVNSQEHCSPVKTLYLKAGLKINIFNFSENLL